MLANVPELGAERMVETIGKAGPRDAAIGIGVAVDKMLIRICAPSIWKPNACSIWTRSFTLPEAATAVFGPFISSRRNRPIKCGMTQCISWSGLSTRHAKLAQVLQMRDGDSSDGTWSIFRGLRSS
jgi:hypothetical protein